MSEHRIQNEGRNALAGRCLNFRVNVGQAWTSSEPPIKAYRRMPFVLEPGDVVLRQARPFTTGLPAGFSDTFGLTPVTITDDMVGHVFGHAHFIEYKSADGRVTQKQQAFLDAMQANGARAGVARSAADAVRIALGYDWQAAWAPLEAVR